MNKLRIFILAFILSLLNYSVAQTVTASGNPLMLPCGGGNVDLSAVGNSNTPVFGDDFNNGSVAPGWSASASAQFDNPCGASVDGTTYLWMGSTTAAPREMTTAAVDVSCGATVCFDFKFTCESCGDSAPCEGADYYNEGVSLQYSTDGGNTWIDFAYFAPNGDLLTSYPGGGVYSPYASGNTNFTSWDNYCFTIPAGAETANTMFQLHQWGSSGSNYDHWGIDNFYVYATPCAPYYYDWAHIPGAPDSPDVTANITQTTTFEVCYTNGIDSVCDQVTVYVDSLPDATVVMVVPPTCFGDCDGQVVIDNPGGNGPYNIVLTGPTNDTYTEGNGGPDDMNASNLCAGDYTYVTNQQNGSCTNSGTFTIPPGTPCCEVDAAPTDVLCNGGTTGSALANPIDGQSPFSYQWDDPSTQTTQSANGLTAGTYSVIMTDNIGCQDTAVVTVNEPTPIAANYTVSEVSCLNSCDGEISLSASGGTPTYTYNLNGGTFGTNSTFTALCGGTYNVIVEDANGCQLSLSNIAVNEPTNLTLVESNTVTATCGVPNGELTVTANGGTSPYSYDIGGVQQSSNTFTGLLAGTYTVTVTDANGCTESINVTVPSGAGPSVYIDVFNDVACFGGVSGSFTVGVNGGTGPFTYYLNPPSAGQPSNTFNGVQAGSHTVEVIDVNGCSGTVNVTLSEPTAITYTTTITDASCNGVCDGQIEVNASGGTPPYEYSDDNGTTYQSSNILTGQCAGTTNLVVQDANGCLVNSTEDVQEPTPLSMNVSFTEPTCNGLSDGTITFGAGGGTPGYQYSVDNGSTFTGTDPVTNIAAGFYNLVLEDANGCQIDDTITVTEPPTFDFVYIANNPSNCGANDGSFEIAAINGLAPYSYSIDGGVTTQGSGYFPNLYSGLYLLHVTDDNGCVDSTNEALSDNVMVGFIDAQVNATCYNSCDGAVNVSQNFGQAPYTYTLNTSGVSQVDNGFFSGLCPGTHYVTIEDDGLCLEIVQVDITHPDSITFDTTLTNITCPGGSDGEVSISNVVGGDGGPYSYSLDGINFVPGSTFTGLAPGTYTVWAQDGNGCLGNSTFTLTEPPAWDVVINSDDLTCYQNNTGFIQVVGDGATPSYSYDLGGNVTVSGIYNGLSAGTHFITVTDVNGCTFDTSHVLNEPAQLTIDNAVTTDALCNGSSDGEIDIDASGGTPIYLYSHDNGVTQQSSDVITGLPAGCYDIHVEDDNGCTATSNVCIGEPTPVTMTMTLTPETCSNDNGEITVNASGGTPGYQYSNNDGNSFQAGNVFSNLSADNYPILIEDINGCEADSIVTLTEDDLPQIDNVITTNVSCFNGSDGALTITSSGGVGAHQYSIGGVFQAGSAFSNLTAGLYTAVVEDANGCQATQQVNIIEPAQLALTATGDSLLCFGDFTGEIQMTVSGGTAPFNYSIDNGNVFQGSGTFSFIAAGTYDLFVEDANGCTITDQITIGEPAPLNWSVFNIDSTNCFGECNGAINADAIGGTSPYSYSWTIGGAGNTNNPTGVCAGQYSVYLTDANGCQIDSIDFEVGQPSQIIIDGVTTTDVLCHGGSTGSIQIDNVINGIAPFQYSVDGGSTYQNGNLFNTANGTPIDTGNYDIVVQDANGCRAFSNVTIYQPLELTVQAPSDWPSCYGETVNIQAFTNGGTQPYNHIWTDDQGSAPVNAATFSATVYDTVLYTVSVEDANGCTATDSYSVMPSPPLEISPVPDTIFICAGEVADLSVTVTGGQQIDFGSLLDYSYKWSTGDPGDTLSTISVSPTSPTDYAVTVTDLCGQVVDTLIHVGINPDPIVGQLGTAMGCAPDYVEFDDMIDKVLPGYSIEWDFGNGTASTETYPTGIYYEYAGTYDVTVTITSDSGCVVSETTNAAVIINENPKPGFIWNPHAPNVMDPTIQIEDLSDNADTYTYTFEDFGTSNLAEPSVTFPVEVETELTICQYITSEDGCSAELCKPITIQEVILFYVPNVFTPDGDDYNEIFKPVFTSGVDPYNYHLTIFNRWGEVIFESYNYDQGWNGHYGDGGLVQDGVYVWQIEFGEKYSDRRQIHRGHVSVLK